MGYIIATASQKGGVGKSTLCRMIAREAVMNGLIAKIADFDVRQSTTKRWTERRMQNGIRPTIRAETFLSVSEALKDAADFDVFLLDGAPQASKQTKEMAVAADLLIIPTGDSFEDREPAVELANDLYSDGVNPAKIAFALCRVGDSKAQLAEARAYLGKTQYTVLDGEMPERDSFKTLIRDGRAPTESPFKSLRKRSEMVAQNAINTLVSANKGRVVA